jgi:hypothetical protein
LREGIDHFSAVYELNMKNCQILRKEARLTTYTLGLMVATCWLMALLAGCESGAVVFAPTPLPPDTSPLRYQHPSGAFSLIVPRTWTIYEQNTTTLASVSFTMPGDYEPTLVIAAVKLAEVPDTQGFSALMLQYQTQVRPDLARYKEQDRQAMGDGSWRLTGLRSLSGGDTQQINTFVERSGALIGVLEVVMPSDTARMAELQTVVNSFRLNEQNALETGEFAVLSNVTPTSLEVVHVATWRTPAGVFFITGEVANVGGVPLSNVPVRAVLYTQDGLGVAEAIDTVMGYTIPPGGFAPFSLRFGQGQPALTNRYTLEVGSATWQPGEAIDLFDSNKLTWTSESSQIDLGLVVSGTVTNIGDSTARNLRATATIFDGANNVIAAGFTNLAPEQLAAGASMPYQLLITEIGGTPANFIVNIQALK